MNIKHQTLGSENCGGSQHEKESAYALLLGLKRFTGHPFCVPLALILFPT